MKKILKLLVLGSLSLGALTGCDFFKKSNNSKSEVISEPSNNVSSFSNSGSANSNSSESTSKSASQSSSKAKTVTGIALDTNKVKLTYELGEKLNLAGLVVKVEYSDGSDETTNNYTTNPTDGTVLNKSGTTKVTVTYAVNGATSEQASFDVSVSKTTWTTDEANTMSSHLYGEVLPYTGLEESAVVYVEQSNMVVIYGGTPKDDTFKNYEANALKQGFKAISNTAYYFQKDINTNNGKRFVRIYFGSNEGKFYLEAYDPYTYSFPSAFASKMVLNMFDSKQEIPAFNADYYETSEQNQAIYCYTNSSTAEADYKATLKAAGWDTKDELYHNFYYAYSPDKKFMISYKYDSKLNDLDIYFVPLNYWNSELITNFFKKYNGEGFEVPTLELSDGQYQFVESEYNEYFFEQGRYESIHAFMYIYGGSNEDIAPYATKLRGLGWDITGENVFTAKKIIGDEGVAKLEFDYDARYGVITITIYFKLDPIPNGAWPAKEVADLLGSDITDVVPAFTGPNNGFSVMTDAYGSFVMVELDQGTEDAAATDYINNTLIPAGYSLYPGFSSVYVSKNNQILVQAYMGTSGSISITFKAAPSTTWPAKRIARMMNDLFGNVTDVLPAYTKGVEYDTEMDKASGEIYVYIDTGDIDIEDAIEEYVDLLTTNKFTPLGPDADGDEHYLSPNGQFDVCPYDNGWDQFTLYITSLEGDNWPTDAITTFFTTNKFTDTLPVFSGEYESATAEVVGYELVITVSLANSSDVSSAVTTYIGQLTTGESFTFVETLPFGCGDVYKSPSEQYTATIVSLTSSFEIRIEEAENGGSTASSFPMSDILSQFPQADGVMPSINATGVEYEVNSYTGCVTIYATFASEDAMNQAYTTFIQALTTAQFIETSIWGGWSTGYYAPDNTFFVYVDTYPSECCIEIDVYDASMDL